MQLGVRLSEHQHARLDQMARGEGITKSDLVRRIIDAALDGEPIAEVDRPDHQELIALLSAKARAGSVSAIRSLLAREDELDPRERALLSLEAMAQERQS